MCRTKPRFSHLFLLILLSVGLFACNQPTEQLLPELEGIEVDIGSLMDAYDIEDFSMQGMLLILYHDDGTTEKIPITPNMIRQVDLELLSSPGTHEITITHGNFTTTFTLTMVYTGLTEQLRLIYHQGFESGLITGTYEDWLDSIKGADGVSIFDAYINEDGHLILTFSNDEFIDVGKIVGLDGVDGKEVIMRVSSGYIQWKYNSEETWKNLIELDGSIGPKGDQGLSAYEIYLIHFPDYVGDEAQWLNDLINGKLEQKEQVDIYFEAMGGEMPNGYEHPIKVIFNSVMTLPIPNKNGYVFMGWYTGLTTNDLQVSNVTPITKSMTLYAKWTAVRTIYFESNGGYFIPPTVVHKGSTIPIPTTYKEGHTLDGWYTSLDNGLTFDEKWSFITHAVNDDMTLYAKWNINQYTMYFDSNGGSPILPITQDFASEVDVADPIRQGYTFLGWDFVLPAIMPSADISVTAQWEINQYAINYITYDQYSPLDDIPLQAGESITSLSLGFFHSSALTSTGRVFTWGQNTYGELGDGTTTDRSTPTEITTQFNLNQGETVISMAAKSQFSSALTSEGRVFMWGNNQMAQLGDGTTTNRYTPTEITTQFDLCEGETFLSMSSGDTHSLALTSKGRVFTWGNNSLGQLGNGTTTTKLTPREITSRLNLSQGETVVSISLGKQHSSVITSDGRLITWGYNNKGQLGDGTTTNRSTPTEITTQFNLSQGETVVSVSLGYQHSSAITSEGRVFTWGHNNAGQLGNGTANWDNITIPTEITPQFDLNQGETVVSISLGFTYSSAITSEGRVFTWGYNGSGQLGDGTTIHRNTPTEITQQFNLNQGERVVSVSLSGSQHSSAITSEGRVFTWGINNYGQLGDGTTTIKLTPQLLPFIVPYSIEIVSFDYNQPVKDYLPHRDGYTFDGWYSNPALTTVYTFSEMSDQSITVFGKWNPNIYTTTFVLNNGEEDVVATDYAGSELLIPTYIDHIFKGWYQDADLTIPYESNTFPTSNMTLYAKWIEATYGWHAFVNDWEGTQAELKVIDGELVLTVTNISNIDTNWKIQIIQDAYGLGTGENNEGSLQFEAGKTYRISFDAKASVAGDMSLVISHVIGGFTPYYMQTLAVTTEMQRFEVIITMDEEDMDYSNLAQFKLEMGFLFGEHATGMFVLDNVLIEVLEEDTYVDTELIVNGTFE